jgi:hypothetical protein
LTEEDLNRLDHYLVEKNKLHNRYLHGWGVVCGLQVICHQCEGLVTVKAGYAIDPCGHDIIVCDDHDFNVVERIRECRRARRRQVDCEPWSAVTNQGCEQVEEQWCLTLAYEEREARPITALRYEKAKSCGCCRGNGQQCGCGCHHHSTASHPATRGRNGDRQTAGHCEPRLICEGYRLDVIPAPPKIKDPTDPTSGRSLALGPGTLTHEINCCREAALKLMAQAPQVGGITPSQAYEACCRYQDAVRNFLLTASLARCELTDALSLISCPPPSTQAPAPVPPAGYLAQVTQTVQSLTRLLAVYIYDCMCLSLLPPCPPEPAEDRLILACLTIKDDKIVRICQHQERRHVLSFPTLAYWLSSLPLGATLSKAVNCLCCGDLTGLARCLRPPSAASLADVSNPVKLFGSFSTVFSQILGTEVLAKASPAGAAAFVDTGDLKGGQVGPVLAELDNQGVEYTVVPLDPWPDEVVAMSERYTPAIFSAGESVLVYTKGTTVVGLSVADETDRLRHDVAGLTAKQAELETVKAQLETLEKEVATLKGTK